MSGCWCLGEVLSPICICVLGSDKGQHEIGDPNQLGQNDRTYKAFVFLYIFYKTTWIDVIVVTLSLPYTHFTHT